MLVFVIPLKSRQVSKSWSDACSIFERTLKSVCNQTSDNFKVIVVCNQKPEITYTHPNVIYLVDDFPIPQDKVYFAKEIDRTRKMLAGIVQAKQLPNTTHIMLVDADDCVSARLAKYVAEHQDRSGWLIASGYWYHENSNFIKVMRKAFYEYCGTSNIIRADLYPVDSYTPENVELLKESYRHKQIRKTLRKQGILLETLPFKGAIYTINNGENTYYGIGNKSHKISWKSRLFRWKSVLDNRLLTATIKREFGLT